MSEGLETGQTKRRPSLPITSHTKKKKLYRHLDFDVELQQATHTRYQEKRKKLAKKKLTIKASSRRHHLCLCS